MATNENYDEGRGNRATEEEEPEERTDGWMTTYADLVTLLLTFFVLLFALSNVDQQKITLFFTSLAEGGMSIERYEEIIGMFELHPDDSGDAPVLPTPPDNTDPEDDPGDIPHDLEGLFLAIFSYIEANRLGNSISVDYEGDFLLITLSNDITFVSNRADVTDDMRLVASDLGRMISAKNKEEETPFEIIVTGHTDSMQPDGVTWRSNRQLSAMRALNFLEVLLDELDDNTMDPRLFSSSGYGEFHPIATNDTPEGRRMNRRVEILVSPQRQIEEARAAISAS